jgi:hypothetical protein
MKLNLFEIVNALATLILAFLLAWDRRKTKREEARERRLRLAAGLSDNPTSCTDHENRLREIEGKLGKINTNLALIKYKLGMPEDE